MFFGVGATITQAFPLVTGTQVKTLEALDFIAFQAFGQDPPSLGPACAAVAKTKAKAVIARKATNFFIMHLIGSMTSTRYFGKW